MREYVCPGLTLIFVGSQFVSEDSILTLFSKSPDSATMSAVRSF